MTAWPPPPPDQGPTATGVSPTPPPSSRFLVGIAVGIVAGLLAGLVGGFVAGRASVDDDGGATSSGFSFGSAEDAEAPSPTTSREDPAPVGTRVEIGNGWAVEVTGFDATPDVDEGMVPPEGKQWVTIAIETTYLEGDKQAQSPFFGLDLSAVGDRGEEYSQADAACFAPAPRFDNLGDVYEGGTASGNLCLAVGTDDVDSIVLVAEPSLNMGRADKSFLAVD